jgi:RNB domain
MSGPGYDSVLGILTRQLGDQLQFYTMQGRWVHRPRKEVYFRVPNFVSQKLVEPVLSYLPSQQLPEHLENRLQFFDSSVPREIGAPLIERMRAFYDSSELIHRETFTVLGNAHSLLSDEKDTLIMSLADVARRLLKLAGRSYEKLDELSPTELYAVHRTLTRSETGFAIQLGGVDVARYFTIYPKVQVEMLGGVRRWVRKYQESLNAQHSGDHTSTPVLKGDAASVAVVSGFVQKARRLIKASRERRRPSRFGCVGPSTLSFSDHSGLLEPIPAEKFSGFEKDIIRFIEIWCSGELGNYSTLNSLPPVILRATGMYDEVDLGSATGFTFLQEIGVYTPWERVSVYHKGLALPGHGVSLKADDYQTRVNNMRKSSPLELVDSMETLRRDWGDMDVYCIDDVQAKEIDDGISLERIPGSNSEYWVHVHVANPSAFIAPDHWIAKMAQKTAETIYTPERTYPMLPSFVVDGKLSLGVNSPVLTFSAKLNKKGEIITYEITPGLIRKVTHLTAGKVDKVLGVQRIEPKVVRVGRETNTCHRPELSDSDVSESQKADFEIFKMLATGRRQKRLSNGAVSVVMPGINCSVFGNVFSGPARPPSRDQARFWRGDPAIEMTSNWFDPTGRGYPAMDGDRIVEELMILASEVAAGWCHARNIPVPYVSSISTPSCKDPMEFHRKVLLSSVGSGGYYPYDLGLEYLRLTAVTVSTAGGPLIRSGVERYARCTSPLRRYSDMLLHWQVEAALRHEAQHGESSLVGNLRSDYLPFSRAQVDELLPWLQWRRRLMTITSRNAQRFWAAQLLMRAVFYGEAELPRTFEMRVVKTVDYRRGVEVFGILMDLNVQVFAIVPDWMEKRGVKIGERYEVEIKDIDVFHTVVRVNPLRLIGDD